MNTFDVYFERGMNQGREEGRLQGREQGRKEGREEGIKSGKMEVVLNLIEQRMFTDKQVAEIANVSADFVKQVRLSSESR